MSTVLNEWLKDLADERTTRLVITGVYTVTVLVDTIYVPQLAKLSWCYEQTKGQVYATDQTMLIPKQLRLNSPRLYLWKYVMLLRTGRIATSWKRTDMSDYRCNHGDVVFANTVNLLSIPQA